MLKKTITFKDLDGNELTEDFYFNLTKAEIAEMQLSQEGGLGEYLTKIIATKNGKEIMAAFKKIITSAVGKRSEDGRKFVKSPEITEDFLMTEAYSVMFMELVTSAEASAEFVRGIMPPDMVDAIVAEDLEVDFEKIQTPEPVDPPWIAENREPTQQELTSMTAEQLRQAYLRKANTLTVANPEG